MSRRIFIGVVILALGACSQDSTIDRDHQKQVEERSSGENDCLNAAKALQYSRSSDWSDTRKPSRSQVRRWEESDAQAAVSFEKCKKNYEQALASGDHCLAAHAAENYASLVEFQVGIEGGSPPVRTALLLADLSRQANESATKCQQLNSGQIATQAGEADSPLTGNEFWSSGQTAQDGTAADVFSSEIEPHINEWGSERVDEVETQPEGENTNAALSSSGGGHHGVMSDMAARKVASKQADDDTNDGARNVRKSPSFDCSRAKTSPDRAICSDSDLAALDVKMAALYKQVQATTRDVWDTERTQSHWLRVERDSCGSDVECLTTSYQARIEALSVR